MLRRAENAGPTRYTGSKSAVARVGEATRDLTGRPRRWPFGFLAPGTVSARSDAWASCFGQLTGERTEIETPTGASGSGARLLRHQPLTPGRAADPGRMMRARGVSPHASASRPSLRRRRRLAPRRYCRQVPVLGSQVESGGQHVLQNGPMQRCSGGQFSSGMSTLQFSGSVYCPKPQLQDGPIAGQHWKPEA